MKVFLGWSGDASRRIAEALDDWIPKVIPHAEVFVSSRAITLGSHWEDELSEALKSANYGVLCVTPDNMRAQWIHYETGQMEASMPHNNPGKNVYVVPLLFGVEHSGDLPSPLSHYQSKPFGREVMRRLVAEMNGVCRNLYGAELSRARSGVQILKTYLEDDELERNFDEHYPELEAAIAPIEAELKAAATPPPASGATSNATPSGSAAASATKSGKSASGQAAKAAASPSQEDDLTVLSEELEAVYLQFGAFPEIARVYFEGRQLLERFRDETVSRFEKGEDLVRFHTILDEAVRKLAADTNDANPNRKTRIKKLKDLIDLVERL